MIEIPAPERFGSQDYLPSAELQEIGERLIEAQFPDIANLDDPLSIEWLWKKKGGTKGGLSIGGKCQKLTGLNRFAFANADYAIWLAADWNRDASDEALEALLFHEICHIEVEVPEDEDKPVIKRTVGHDVETFYREIETYGLWNNGLRQLGAVVQPKLPGM